MKKLFILPMLLVLMGASAFAATVTNIDISGVGDNALHTGVSESGYKYGTGLRKTANIETTLVNVGNFKFSQDAETFGNGLEWPNGAEHEWSLLEVQDAKGSGDTQYMKDISVWTVDAPWWTTYEGAGDFDTLTQDYDYAFNGENKIDVTVKHLTDEPFKTSSLVFVNPW